MKRHEILRYLDAHGCQLLREGTRHSIYLNPVTRKTSTIPRHVEIANTLARKICRDLGLPSP